MLLNETNAHSSLSYGYDGTLLNSIIFGGLVKGNLTARYDDFLRVKSLDLNGTTINFGFDKDGLLTEAGSLLLARDSANGKVASAALGSTTTIHSYDRFGRVASMVMKVGGSDLFSEMYVRDALGRVKQKTSTQSGEVGEESYEYDESGRLSKVRNNGSIIAAYSYDDNGNRTSAHGYSARYDDQDRLIDFGEASYEYTANGELSKVVAAGHTTQLSYNGMGALAGVVLPNGSAVEYIVDGKQRRIGKKINGVLTQGFLYQDELRPVAELNGDDQVVARFVYAERLNVPEYMIKSGVIYRFVLDRIGSVRMVVNAQTGAVAQALKYDVWGNVVLDTNPGFQPFGYAGGLYDRDTGLVRFGARDYDPYTARWTSKDPLLFAGGTRIYTHMCPAIQSMA